MIQIIQENVFALRIVVAKELVKETETVKVTAAAFQSGIVIITGAQGAE